MRWGTFQLRDLVPLIVEVLQHIYLWLAFDIICTDDTTSPRVMVQAQTEISTKLISRHHIELCRFERITLIASTEIAFYNFPCFMRFISISLLDTQGPFRWFRLNSTPAWIGNCILSKVWYEITYPFPNFNSCSPHEICRSSAPGWQWRGWTGNMKYLQVLLDWQYFVKTS